MFERGTSKFKWTEANMYEWIIVEQNNNLIMKMYLDQHRCVRVREMSWGYKNQQIRTTFSMSYGILIKLPGRIGN
jgi:hypothetical protein